MRKSLLVLLLATTACAGPPGLVAGESVIQPDPPPPMLVVQVTATDDLMPLAGAAVTMGDDTVTTEDDGLAESEWRGQLGVEVTAPGFLTSRIDLMELPDDPIEVNLQPVQLRGQVRAADGRPLPGTPVEMNGELAVADEAGMFVVNRAVPGAIRAARPAWEDAEAHWDGAAPSVEVVMNPVTIRALRVGGDAAADPAHWEQVLELAEMSTVNAFVIDTKDETGVVMWDTDVETAEEIGAEAPLFDVDRVIRDMDAHDLYKITRVVTFQDNFMARARPDLATTDSSTGELWESYGGTHWMDATDEEAWEYPLALAADACERGFDEVQFDYVRFPSDGPVQRLVFDAEVDGELDGEARVSTIAAFLNEARSRLHPLGCAVSADIFGVVVSVRTDQGIGQRPEELSSAVDVISPMIYPSHYGKNWLNFDDPNAYPSEVVGGALDDAMPRLVGPAVLRPWLQTYPYGRTEIEIEIDEAEQRDLGWMLWSAGTQFAANWLPPEPGVEPGAGGG